MKKGANIAYSLITVINKNTVVPYGQNKSAKVLFVERNDTK